jgi:gliding motility-associated-like protein
MQFANKILLLISFCTYSFLSKAQIYGPSAIASFNTVYKISGEPDKVFLFDKEKPNKEIYIGSPGYDIAVFEWSLYNPSIGNYDLPFAKNTGTYSKINITSNQGYRVIVHEIARTDTFRCWVIIDDFGVTITSTIDDTIQTTNIYCGYINKIEARLDTFALKYYNPQNNYIITLRNIYIATWTSNYPDDAEPPDNSISIYGNQLKAKVSKPYWKDTWYIIEVKDDYGLVRRDSAFYKSIEPHASFDPVYIRLDNLGYYPPSDSIFYDSTHYNHTSAPAKYLFKNNSENADSYTWLFGDGSFEPKSNKDSVLHTYKIPGSYYVKLIASRKVSFRFDPCIDSVPSDSGYLLKIDPAQIDKGSNKAPNVFVVPPAFENENWRLYDDVSITEIEIAIYNRYGRKVHYFKGNIHDWLGWDGQFKGHDVPEGVYYYVVKKINLLPTYESTKAPDALPKDETRNFIHVFHSK